MYPLLNEVDLGTFTNCSSALGTLKPSRTVLRLFIDSEMLLMMKTMNLHKLFFGPLTDDEILMLMKALHKLFFGPSLIDDDDDDDEKLRRGDDEVTMKASSDWELVMMKANSDRELVM
ncbi:organic cation transporter-like [Oryza sativa Japonica Group]|uniref:Organic cation transporter-like n=1 Tax=Oryza sativa subsp. japonica TaxID=39947 RepID=Q8LHB7_ORYSJ|nr:organic cation transporter-like [Oryza sativa Japonica Group]